MLSQAAAKRAVALKLGVGHRNDRYGVTLRRSSKRRRKCAVVFFGVAFWPKQHHVCAPSGPWKQAKMMDH
jgi:hypothetical protein